MHGVDYQPAAWHDLFTGVAGASATLEGLLFVAVSLNHARIIASPTLPPLTARTMTVLLSLLLLSVLALIPGADRTSLGAETTTMGVLLVGVLTRSAVRAHTPVVQWPWTASAVGIALASSVPMLVLGVSLLDGAGGGLYWAVVDVAVGFAFSVYHAWILLIEIVR